MIICPENNCSGCYACANACPKQAFSLSVDKYGELHPVINENKCIQCNLCIRVCPNNIQQRFNYPLKCYAAWITDRDKRRKCASGGIGTILSEYVINQLNGVVFGSRYNEDLTPVMSYTDKVEDLDNFKGSRYVQSIVGEKTYYKVRHYLKEGRYVLFIGTPCQISGLKGYLQKDYDHLITVDLICHGCCPTSYFIEEISYLKQKNRIKYISDIRFRGNDRNDFCLSIWNDNKRVFKAVGLEQPYFAGFLLGTSLRENCYSCQYARPERISDLTIGDFIGLGRIVPFKYSTANVSSVTLNTNKGLHFYQDVQKTCSDMKSIERDYSERLMYKPSLLEPFPRHYTNAAFREAYISSGFSPAIRKVLSSTIRHNKMKRLLNTWTYVYRIPRKLIRMLKDRF